MIPRRRLALQLTPLLDLMLIVMFSQHLAFRQHTATEQQALEQRHQTLLSELKTQQEQLDRQRESLNRQYLESAQLLNTFLSPSQNAQLARQLANFDDLRKTLEQHTSATPDGAVRFLTRLCAMQDKVTIIEVHLLDSGTAELRCDDRTESANFASPEQFADQLFKACKKFPTPRSLTIVLLSWGDIQFGIKQSAEAGLPRLLEELRRDAAGIRWYDSSITGYRPRGVLSDPLAPRSTP